MNRPPPTSDIEVLALSALAGFPEARARFEERGLDVGVFGHPFAQWLAAKFITGAAFTAEEAESLTIGTPDALPWIDALEWLRPTDPAWAVSLVDLLAHQQAGPWLIEHLRYAADSLARGARPEDACAGVGRFLRMLAQEREAVAC